MCGSTCGVTEGLKKVGVYCCSKLLLLFSRIFMFCSQSLLIFARALYVLNETSRGLNKISGCSPSVPTNGCGLVYFWVPAQLTFLHCSRSACTVPVTGQLRAAC